MEVLRRRIQELELMVTQKDKKLTHLESELRHKDVKLQDQDAELRHKDVKLVKRLGHSYASARDTSVTALPLPDRAHEKPGDLLA